MAWNDAFRFEQVAEDAYMLINTKQYCAGIGAPPQINIYAGPLQYDKYVAILLNRDNKPQEITLKWEFITGITPESLYLLRDVYNRKPLGWHQGTFTSSVDAHSVLVLTLS